MCGIAGVLSKSPVDRTAVEHMRDQLAHRGPDSAGLWRSSDERVCLGHRRLAIIDLNPNANQPFISSDGRYALTYNGEIYNFQSLRRSLEELGARFRTNSDTEVLIEAYRAWGEACLQRLSGQFAFALWDNVERTLFCARDRAGEKPFYYAVMNGVFLFGSELKALLAWPGFRRTICYPAMIDYLALGYAPDPKTIWEDCWKLPAGMSMSVTLGADGVLKVSEPVAYWDLEFDPDETERDWGGRIRGALEAACAEMAIADVPLGCFLSGGVDSSSVAAALARAGNAVSTFTVGFDEQAYDERPWARQVAELYGTKHTERVVAATDVNAVLDKMLWHYDEPFNDYSYLPTYYVCREARKHITVALSGDGGDELFAGYRKYQRINLRAALDGIVPTPVTTALASGAHALLPASSLRERMSHYAQSPAEMVANALYIGFDRAALRTAAGGQLADELAHYDPFEMLTATVRKAPPEKVGLLNAMRYLDFKVGLSGDMLVKVDRASMAVSLEVRPVYLNRSLLDIAGRIPPRLLIQGNETKSLLKSALRPWLPDTILYRPKQGFALPLQAWLKGELGETFATSKTGAMDELLPKRATLLRHQAMTGRDNAGAAHSLFFLDQWLARWAA